MERNTYAGGFVQKAIFPRNMHWILVAVLLVYRVNYVLNPDNWWILHPDEVFQTVEVAHTEAFGYGFRPYEYLQQPPRADNNTTFAISTAHAQEVSRGMYSLRSFILPRLLSYVLLLASQLHVRMSPFLVAKLLHVTFTSFLPASVYWFASVLHHSHDVATLSAILISCSPSLNVFGTHTLINSFVSPFHFLAIAVLTDILNKSASVYHEKERHSSSQGIKTDQNGKAKACKDEKSKRVPIQADGVPSDYFNKYCVSTSGCQFNDISSTARFTISNYFWSSDKDATSKSWKEISVTRTIADFQRFLSGFLLGVTIYIRIDLVLLPMLLVVLYIKRMLKSPSMLLGQLKAFACGVIAAVLFGGYVDYETFDNWFLSPIQWFKFNVLNKTAESVFGSSSSSYYAQNLLQQEPMILFLIVVQILYIGLSCYRRQTQKLQVRNFASVFLESHSSLCIFISLFVAYSAQSHKELRFLHNVIVLMYISLASALVSLYEQESKEISNQKKSHKLSPLYVLYMSLCIIVSCHIYHFHSINGSKLEKWTYSKNVLSADVNKCLDFLQHHDDVTGIFLDVPIHMTGAYSILHQDVPIFALNQFEYLEFDKTLKTSKTPKSLFTRGISSFSLISEFISVHNSYYLVKHLFRKTQYNYVVTKSNKDFLEQHYETVYNTGKIKVLKRRMTNESEAAFKELYNRLPFGTNATLLEYEGQWLSHFGCYEKAESRLMLANRLNSTLLGPFQLLMAMYKQLNSTENYGQVYKACLQVHSPTMCNRKYTPIRLHSQYFRQ